MLLALSLLACTPNAPELLESGPDSGPAEVHPVLAPDFLSIAHRGGRRLAPEHTMLAYENADTLGVNMLECDAHTSSEGVVVCMHDVTVDRTTDGSGPVNEHSLEQLQALDAAYHFQQNGEWPHRGQGVQVPTLEQALRAFPEQLWSIEIKQHTPSIVPQLLQVLSDTGMQDRAVLMSFYPVPMEELRAAAPELLTALTTTEAMELLELSEDQLDDWVPPGAQLHAPPELGEYALNAETLARARRVGLEVVVWTINDRDALQHYLDLGVDGIFTDDPALLEDLLGR